MTGSNIINTNSNKRWIFSAATNEDNLLSQDEIISQILLNRGIAPENQKRFLCPEFESLHDPFLLEGMRDAVAIIGQAVQGGVTIGVFADYDADGIPGAALLVEALKIYGLKTVTYIPSRKEGYGLNHAGLDYLKEAGAKLIITVDLGVRDIEEAQYADSIGLKMIITDHHEPGQLLPKVPVLINPKLKNSAYPFRDLSGGAVVFKLIQALSIEFGKISNNDLKWMLDLVGITTICDVVPLVDENRIFAKYGLIVLRKTRRIGLKKLYDVAGINQDQIDTYTVGYQIGPRINAPGRMDHTNQSYELLVCTDAQDAKNLAKKLDIINFERQAKLDQIIKNTEEQIVKRSLNKQKIIMLWDKYWPSGVIGLVAGKITEKYNRPSFVFEKGEKISKGSARSIDNFNLVEVLEQVKPLMINFGGHAKAAGLTIANDNFTELSEKLMRIADHNLTDEDLIPKIKIDAVLSDKFLNLGFSKKLEKLEPFGLGNPKPVFLLKKVKLSEMKAIGRDMSHLKMKVNGINAIAFGKGNLITKLRNQNNIDLCFNLDADHWNGYDRIQLKIIDINH